MKRDDEYLENGSVICWSRRFEDGQFASGKIRWRVSVRCGQCGQVREVSAGTARGSGFSGLCLTCAQIITMEDKELANSSVILWSRRYENGRYADGSIRWRVPVRCGQCGKVREVSAGMARAPGLTGLCRTCAHSDEKFHIPKATLERLYHDEGLSQAQAADRLGCDRLTVRRRMREQGVAARPSSVPQTKVPEGVLRCWSPELAYVVGMITADGNLKRGRNTVRLGSTDYQWIETYQECLQIDAPVHEKSPQKPEWSTFYVVQFDDSDYRAFLERVGLTPAKSTERTLGPLNVPDAFFRDFLRGCIDGDGGIYVHPRKRRSIPYLVVVLNSVCRPFLAWIEETVERLIGLKPNCLRQVGAMCNLEYYSGKAQRLLEWLYYAPDLPCLERKRAVWEDYLRTREG